VIRPDPPRAPLAQRYSGDSLVVETGGRPTGGRLPRRRARPRPTCGARISCADRGRHAAGSNCRGWTSAECRVGRGARRRARARRRRQRALVAPGVRGRSWRTDLTRGRRQRSSPRPASRSCEMRVGGRQHSVNGIEIERRAGPGSTGPAHRRCGCLHRAGWSAAALDLEGACYQPTGAILCRDHEPPRDPAVRNWDYRYCCA
jgi:hypothetical protein